VPDVIDRRVPAPIGAQALHIPETLQLRRLQLGGDHLATGHSPIVRHPKYASRIVMICFDQGHRRFNYRVVGVAIHNDSVLLHRANDEPFWTLPGGRAEHGETAEQTIAREMREELDTDVEVDRLLWIVENFFEFGGSSYHELALYFAIRVPPGSVPLRAESFDRSDGGVPLRFKWFPVQEAALAALPVMPPFLAEALTHLPPSAVHVVDRDRIEGELSSRRA
jgi:8-oxo-dGTP pyrophosphatase MutT (NUDIX family)